MTNNIWNSQYNDEDAKLLIGNTSVGRPLVGDITIPDGTITKDYSNPNLSLNVTNSSVQSCFHAVKDNLNADVTGDGTVYQIVYATTDFNVGSDYDTSNGRYTAPKNGIYSFIVSQAVTNIGTQSTMYYELEVYDSGFSTLQKKFEILRCNPSTVKNDGDIVFNSGMVITELNSGEIVIVNASIGVGGDSKTVGVQEGFFNGTLLG